jgi:hypothetical protein
MPAARSLDAHDTAPRSWRWIALSAAGFFAAIIALYAAATAFDSARSGRQPDVLFITQNYALAFAPWLFLCPMIFLVSRAGAMSRRSVIGIGFDVVVLFAVCAVAVFAHLFFVHAPLLGVSGGQLLAQSRAGQWAVDVFLVFLCFVAGRADGEQALKLSERRQRLRLAAELEVLERQATTLELRELRHRFSSHFLLNALSNVLGLVRIGDLIQAEAALLTLGEILKRVSRDGGAGLSTVHDELDFLRLYLDFQRIRFPHARFRIDADPALFTVAAPRFLLQPLAENVFKHGLGASGSVDATLSLKPTAGGVAIVLENTLPSTGWRPSADGEGLELTKARLKLSYGDDFDLQRGVSNNRFRLQIILPARELA